MAVLIFAIGGGMSFYEGIKHIQHPEPLEAAGWNYVVLGLSFLFEGIAFYLSVKALLAQADANVGFVKMLRTSKDPAVFASVMENLAALVGLALAGIGVFLGHWLNNPYFDGGASIAIGLLLMLVAVFLVGRTKGLLVGTGVDATTLANLERIAREQPQVRDIRSPLTMYLGPNDVIMALDVDFADHLTSQRSSRRRRAFAGRHPGRAPGSAAHFHRGQEPGEGGRAIARNRNAIGTSCRAQPRHLACSSNPIARKRASSGTRDASAALGMTFYLRDAQVSATLTKTHFSG